MMNAEENLQLIKLLEETFNEEILHLRLRRIREIQAPRFDKIATEHPEIKETFLEARTIHDSLREIRRERIIRLTSLIEEPIEHSYTVNFNKLYKVIEGPKTVRKIPVKKRGCRGNQILKKASKDLS